MFEGMHLLGADIREKGPCFAVGREMSAKWPKITHRKDVPIKWQFLSKKWPFRAWITGKSRDLGEAAPGGFNRERRRVRGPAAAGQLFQRSPAVELPK